MYDLGLYLLAYFVIYKLCYKPFNCISECNDNILRGAWRVTENTETCRIRLACLHVSVWYICNCCLVFRQEYLLSMSLCQLISCAKVHTRAFLMFSHMLLLADVVNISFIYCTESFSVLLCMSVRMPCFVDFLKLEWGLVKTIVTVM